MFFPLQSNSPPWVRKPLPPQREPFVCSRLLSLGCGRGQLSFVFCLNTEWQSTNITPKNSGLSFCKSYCIKSGPKIAEWPTLHGQGNFHRATKCLGYKGKRLMWNCLLSNALGIATGAEEGAVYRMEQCGRGLGGVKWWETALLSHLLW